MSAVTREDAISFLETACRNWSKLPKLSEEDIGDVSMALLQFVSLRSKPVAGVEFDGLPLQKLEGLIERGWQVNGCSIQKDDAIGLVTVGGFVGWFTTAQQNAATAEEERDALLAALGFRPGSMANARDVILKDAAGLRPEMVRARNAERELKSDRDWDRLAAAELLRKWVRRKFGPWITWRTAWAAVDEIFPGRQALSEGEQNG